MDRKHFILGSRGSALALKQSHGVAAQLKSLHPDCEIEIKVIKTTGDLMLKTPFTQMVGRGFFTKEIEEALLKKEIDFAVHSLKDLQTEILEGLVLACVPKREDPRDVLISHKGQKLMELAQGSTMGTSSPRRQVQLALVRPDLKLVPLRGNLTTRIQKVGSSVDAAILALAGLKRMGMEAVVTERLSLDVMLPAAGQGFLGIEAREEDTVLLEKLKSLEDPESRLEADAERAFLAAWGGGCSVPVGAYAKVQGSQMTLQAVAYLDTKKKCERDSISGNKDKMQPLTATLAKRLKEK